MVNQTKRIMKELSIGEKAKEYSLEPRANSHCGYDEEDLENSFLVGANYVLDIFEKEIPLEDNRNLNDYGKALVWRLKECIKQLKKEGYD